MFKNQKGITLIALVITIIVLLILAGITIALITNNDSAPNKAAEARLIQDVGAAKDAVAINAANLMTEYYEAKYVNNSTTSTSTPQAYIKAHKDDLIKDVTAAKINVDADVSGLTSGNTFTITSHDSASRDVNGTATAQKYQVTGTVEEGGTITWGTGTWVNA